jgi:hypothetical protein
MFPAGAIPPDDPLALLARTREFLQNPPRVPPSKAFLLEDSMQRTLELYQSVCQGAAPGVLP